MTARRWFDNDAADRWAPIAFLLLLGFSAPGVLDDAFHAPSVWHTAVAAVWLIAVLGFAAMFVRRWLLRTLPGGGAGGRRVDPETVPTSEVQHAVNSTGSRVSAVKQLRERHPGLGLADAVHLIDAAREQPHAP